jgi:hypothetical protein
MQISHYLGFELTFHNYYTYNINSKWETYIIFGGPLLFKIDYNHNIYHMEYS